MADVDRSFSDRHGYQVPAAEITFREGAPDDLRGALIMLAESLGLRPSGMRSSICAVLLKAPDIQNNWSEYPNVIGEVRRLIEECPWHKVYDIAEQFYRDLETRGLGKETTFQDRLNAFFVENGIGWSMESGLIVARGSEVFAKAPSDAIEQLTQTGRQTAAKEMREAMQDLSRRPHPDITGSIQHAMAALECTLRDFAGQPKKTLGEVLSAARGRGQVLVPPPLDKALELVWGYASETGRHLREGREPTFGEAELVVTISAAVCVYVARAEPVSDVS